MVNLTSRQIDVVRLIANGLTNQQIGTELGISAYTVRSHVTNIMDRFDAVNRVQSVYKALQEGTLNVETCNNSSSSPDNTNRMPEGRQNE